MKKYPQVNSAIDSDGDECDFFDKDSISSSSTNSQLHHTGRLLDKSNSLLSRNTWLAKVCIMIVVMLERTSYYGLLGNLAIYVSTLLKFTNTASIEWTLGFSALTWITCFIGGMLGDVVWGRCRTIFVGLCLYIIGYLNLVLLSHFYHKGPLLSATIVNVWLFFTLFVISLGEGFFKSNMSPFGADQLQDTNESEMRNFFNYFYWSMNIGALVGYSLITWIQQTYGFVRGYIVPTCLLGLALVIFTIPRSKNYHITVPKENLMKTACGIFCNARRKNRISSSYESYNPVRHWLDWAKIKFGGKYSDDDVEEIKKFCSILCVFSFIIIYCTCYYQISATFLLQGLHMKLFNFHFRYVTHAVNPVPPAWFMLFNILCVLIFVPIIDRFVYPCLGKIQIISPAYLRMAIGMLFASLGMVSAGTVERFRMQAENTTNRMYFSNISAKNMEIDYQLPQYIFLGLSEIFVMITGLEFAYCQSPKAFQSLATSFFFVANGLGAVLGIVFIKVGNALKLNITSEKHNKGMVPPLNGHLEYFYYFLACLNFMNLVFFLIYAARKARSKRKKATSKLIADYIQEDLNSSLRS